MAADYGRFVMKNNGENNQSLPSFVVCLAAFNGSRWLAEQVKSILDQTGVSVIIFVSVDRSTDETEEWFRRCALSDNRVVLLANGMTFGGASRNFFRLMKEVDFSRFDYVSFADQDDIWLPNKLLRAHEMLSSIGADAYSSNVVAFWPNGRKVLVKKSQRQTRWDFLFEAAGPGCTYVMRKDLICAIQCLIKNRWDDIQKIGLHDWFVYAFARGNGYQWVIDDCPGMLYRQHEHNQVGVNSGTRAFVQRARKVLNGWGLTQSALIAQLVGLGDDPFVKRWSGGSRAGLLWLGFHAWQCRRRMRDKIIFSFSCIAMCLVGSRHE